MNQINRLETEINECRERIRQLEEEQLNLEEVKRQNGIIANDSQQYVWCRRGYADNFHQYNQKTTISKLIAGKLEEGYSRSEEVKLLDNYDEIEKELQRAIQKIEEEIEDQNEAIRVKQRRMEEIKEEERRERERRERERRERESRERES